MLQEFGPNDDSVLYEYVETEDVDSNRADMDEVEDWVLLQTPD